MALYIYTELCLPVVLTKQVFRIVVKFFSRVGDQVSVIDKKTPDSSLGINVEGVSNVDESGNIIIGTDQ